jgi:large subunit ribosomal protein L5
MTKKIIKNKTVVVNDKYRPTLLNLYRNEILQKMIEKYNYSNIMEVPKLLNISINIGLGDAKTNSKGLESALNELSLISGQKPIVTLAKKDISNFKIRKGWPVGCKVTLRSVKMYEFLDRLISIALPRTRDFRGLSFKSFDSMGNFNFGIKEQIIFTEIDYDKIHSIKGMNITIVTSTSSDSEAYSLLKMFGLPLREKPKNLDKNEAA